jgi:hypothetical protein
MAWAYVQDNEELPLDVYDAVAREVGGEENPPDGLIVHVAGEGPKGGMRFIDVWESKEAYERFQVERLLPAIERATGGPPEAPPEKLEHNVHHIVSGLTGALRSS